MATKAEIRARIADEIFRTDLNSQIDRYIAAAIRHYEKTRFWFNEGRRTVAYTSGSNAVTLPTGTQQIDAIFDDAPGANGWQLRRREPELLSEWIVQGSVPNQLSDYALDGAGLRLYGTPSVSSTLTLQGFFNTSELADGDANGWTTEGQDALVARVKLMICRAITMDAVGAAAARAELFGTPGDRGDLGAEGELLRQNRARMSAGRVKLYY